jgi:5'-nucleotidase
MSKRFSAAIFWRALLVCVTGVAAMPTARALDIVVTNDDGMESALSYALYLQLKAAGHRVVVSAPAADQSGRGGALDIMRPIVALPAGTRGGCVLATTPPAPGVGNLGMTGPWLDASCPHDADIFWVESTPTGSALYGIDVAAQLRFGHAPDLVISGPNFGANTGMITNGSGTVNAALMAVNRGIPAIAVSAEDPTTYRSLRTGVTDADKELAQLVLRLVAAIDQPRAKNRAGVVPPLLPEGLGLNVNVPKFEAGTAAALKFKLTDIATSSQVTPVFMADMCVAELVKTYLAAACQASGDSKLQGVGVVLGGQPIPSGLTARVDNNPRSEQRVLASGVVAVSVMQGTHQATTAGATSATRQLRQLLR